MTVTPGGLRPDGPLAAAPPFDDFFRDEYPKLVALGLALTGSRSDAEESAQEVLLRAYRDWTRIGGYERPGAWARRVMVNLVWSARRRCAREDRAYRRLVPLEATAAVDPDDARFWTAVRSLPRRQQAAVTLFYLEDLAVADVAAALDCTAGTVKRHLHDARRSLARALDVEDDR